MTYEKGVIAGLLTAAMNAVESAAKCSTDPAKQAELWAEYNRLVDLWAKYEDEK